MKHTLLTLFLIFSVNAFGQSKTIDEIDKFTKDRTIQVNAMKGKKWNEFDDIAEKLYKTVYLSLKHVGGTNFLQLNAVTYSSLCLSEDSRVILLFADDSTIELFNKSKTDCAHQYQSLTGKYFITTEQINELLTKDLKEFRIYYSEGYSDFVVKKDKKNVIRKTAEMFLESI